MEKNHHISLILQSQLRWQVGSKFEGRVCSGDDAGRLCHPQDAAVQQVWRQEWVTIFVLLLLLFV